MAVESGFRTATALNALTISGLRPTRVKDSKNVQLERVEQRPLPAPSLPHHSRPTSSPA